MGNFIVDEGEVITNAKDVVDAGGAERVNAAVEQAKLMNIKQNGIPSFATGTTTGTTVGSSPLADKVAKFNSTPMVAKDGTSYIMDNTGKVIRNSSTFGLPTGNETGGIS
jgi:hypothetical protein